VVAEARQPDHAVSAANCRHDVSYIAGEHRLAMGPELAAATPLWRSEIQPSMTDAFARTRFWAHATFSFEVEKTSRAPL